jgi:cytochrome c-type biogenesis protein CcmH/NrfF
MPRGLPSRRVHRSHWLGAALALFAVAWIGLSAPRVSAEAESWGYALAHELMSPYCPGRSLAACTSDQAAELRQWILIQEAAGASQEEVVAILGQRFGDVIRSSPEPEGWGLAAWLLPGAVVLLGALAVVGVLRGMVAKPARESSAASRAPSTRLPTGELAQGADAEIARLVDEEIAAAER